MDWKNLKILIAEDDNDDKLLIQDALDDIGIKFEDTFYVSDGEELLNKLKIENNLPLLILLDLNMPIKDGRQALKEIKNSDLLKHIPVIIFTTSSSEEDIKISYKFGTNTYFTKPSLYSEMVEIMELIKKYWLEKARLALD